MFRNADYFAENFAFLVETNDQNFRIWKYWLMLFFIDHMVTLNTSGLRAPLINKLLDAARE